MRMVKRENYYLHALAFINLRVYCITRHFNNSLAAIQIVDVIYNSLIRPEHYN